MWGDVVTYARKHSAGFLKIEFLNYSRNNVRDTIVNNVGLFGVLVFSVCVENNNGRGRRWVISLITIIIMTLWFSENWKVVLVLPHCHLLQMNNFKKRKTGWRDFFWATSPFFKIKPLTHFMDGVNQCSY